MANGFSTEELNANGLSLLSYNDIQETLENGFNEIYAQDGETINFGSETQDGQVINIFSQAGSDNRELARQVYNSFNPDNCEGSVQDQRYSINFITRKPGFFTIQNIDMVINKTVTLQGLDAQYNNPAATSYTVSDNGGQLWFLIDSVTLAPGTYSLPFRSQNYGLYIPAIGTITNQVTTIIGVVSVNNSVAPTSFGEEQESSMEFMIRRSRSTAKKGQNNLDALNAVLLDLSGVKDCFVHNNPDNETDATGTPANTVWIIVEGGANSDIGAAIYQYSCGLPTRGNVSVPMRSISGEIFTTKFDRANPIPLYIKFDYETPQAVSEDVLTSIKNYIAENLTYVLNETAETSKVTCTAKNAILNINGSGYPLNVEISIDGENYTDLIQSASLQNKFVVDASKIYITNTSI